MDKIKIVRTDNPDEPWSVMLPNGVEYDTHEFYTDAIRCATNLTKTDPVKN